ncbi:MAG: RodZ domain-containing protein [Halomonas sp.]
MSDTHEPDLHADASASPGEQLSREREQQGLSIAEVADALNLRPAVIRGLENDSYEEVPVATYRRGYLRAYAHLLGIDDGPVLAAYRARFGSEDAAQRKVTPVQITKPPSRLGAWLFRLVTLLVLAGLIGLTLMWWQSRGGNGPPALDQNDNDPVSVDRLDGSGSEPEEATAPDGDTDNLPPLPEEAPDADAVAPIDDASEQAEEAPQDDDAMGESADESVDADLAASLDEPETAGEEEGAEADDGDSVAAEEAAAAEEEGDEAASEPRDEAGRLELTFNEQSWTEIFDASNERVLAGLQEPGTTASVEGEPPFRLTVGNATGVELVWQGESVDLGERAGANNVARFTLGE